MGGLGTSVKDPAARWQVTRGRAAFIVAHNRQELLNQTIAAIEPQVDVVIVLDNASDPPLEVGEGIHLLFVERQPPNLAMWWNIGMNMADRYFRLDKNQPYDLAILCDDAIVPEGWFDAVTQAMREANAAAGSSSPWGHPFGTIYKDRPDNHIMHRMCSWAFIVDGTTRVRADESMHWWWFDSDLDFRLRQSGGTVLIGTHPVANAQPNHYTNVKPELGEQAGRDRATFAAKWGGTPW